MVGLELSTYQLSDKSIDVREMDECYLSSGFANLTSRLITQKV